MKNFIKNIVLLIVALVLSYYTAEYFGTWYDKFAPLYSTSFFAPSKEGLMIIMGIPFAYVFFTTLLFQIFGSGNRNKWTGWLLAPALLFFAAGDLRHFYLPIVLGLVALGISYLVRRMFIKRTV